MEQEIETKYEEDANKRFGTWIARHTNGAFDKEHSFGDWTFYDDNSLADCPEYQKECNDEDRK